INMKSSIFAGVLLLSAAVLSVDGETGVQRFKRQHMNRWMSSQGCTFEIRSNRIMNDDGSCKKRNTFINDYYDNVKAICSRGQKKGGNLYQSNKLFSIVQCTLQSGTRFPDCEYRNDSPTTRKKIVIGCNDYQQPVHFEEFM
ncbi:ribonuclease-like 3, partial [Etheostoma spectabile]|uniref:ribonuclease-like 3 n=1 Tax=Etheostoma spectabile TaxID=54343 RepID=UPI0013AF3D41